MRVEKRREDFFSFFEEVNHLFCRLSGNTREKKFFRKRNGKKMNTLLKLRNK
jgi:hypothetical protein